MNEASPLCLHTRTIMIARGLGVRQQQKTRKQQDRVLPFEATEYQSSPRVEHVRRTGPLSITLNFTMKWRVDQAISVI